MQFVHLVANLVANSTFSLLCRPGLSPQAWRLRRPGLSLQAPEHTVRKEQPHMSIALRNKQLLALVILAFLTVLVISFVLLSAVGHVNVFHMVGSLITPDWQYNHG